MLYNYNTTYKQLYRKSIFYLLSVRYSYNLCQITTKRIKKWLHITNKYLNYYLRIILYYIDYMCINHLYRNVNIEILYIYYVSYIVYINVILCFDVVLHIKIDITSSTLNITFVLIYSELENLLVYIDLSG